MARFGLVALALVLLLLLLPAPVQADGPPLGGFVMDSFEIQVNGEYWNLSGHVTNCPAGVTIWVEFFGAVGDECAVAEDGSFSLTVQVGSGHTGTVGAYGVATDGITTLFTNICYDTVD